VSNVFKDQCRFFTVPRELVESRLLAKLPPSAVRLYLVLLFLAQKHSAVQIETVAYEMADYTQMDAKSVKTARESLEKAGLIACHKGQHGIITYQLLNPESRLPLPAPPGKRGIREHRPQPGRSARTVRQIRKTKNPAMQPDNFYPPSWDEISRDERGEPGEDELLLLGMFPEQVRKSS
jgi:hypothetical protein